LDLLFFGPFFFFFDSLWQFCAAQILSMIPSGAAAAAADCESCGAAADMTIALLHCVPPMVELSEQVFCFLYSH
jgi:hypothetical protein